MTLTDRGTMGTLGIPAITRSGMVNVSGLLKEAWTAVDEAELPENLQEVAFREAIRLMAPSATTPSPTPGVRSHRDSSDAVAGHPDSVHLDGKSGGTTSEQNMYDQVVAQVGVDRNKLEQIVHLDGDDPRLSIPGLKLGKTTAERARAVAQVISITRVFGLGESDVSLETVRSECERLRVYDQANFSTQMKALPGYVVTGQAEGRRLRPRAAGIEAFPGLVDGLLALHDRHR